LRTLIQPSVVLRCLVARGVLVSSACAIEPSPNEQDRTSQWNVPFNGPLFLSLPFPRGMKITPRSVGPLMI
jgi:hypothetical protein